MHTHRQSCIHMKQLHEVWTLITCFLDEDVEALRLCNLLRSLREEVVAEMLLSTTVSPLGCSYWSENQNTEQRGEPSWTLIFGSFHILQCFSGPLENPNCPFLPQSLLADSKMCRASWSELVGGHSKERKRTQVDAGEVTTWMFLSVFHKISGC